ncbi:MAG: hypothetical protein KDC44_06435, partial [Phaeodactylibacter sp.]|nr:hypothetical protein [Phaeodactylibacter sp.]
MNDPNKHEKSLDRQAFVKAFQSKQTEQTPWDANSFEGKALKGLQHLKVDTDLSGILNELDQRIDRARPSQ